MKNNIGKLFYKDYYTGVDFSYVLNGDPSTLSKDYIRDKNQRIKSSALVPIPYLICCKQLFQAEILYPGLVTGVGLVHDSKKLDGAFNLGMHFDYTTGMPIVYGSSVKGVLKSYFEDFCQDKGIPDEDIKDLQNEVFDGKRKDGSNISIYERDVFFDAVIVKVDKKGRLLEDDSITPHTEGPLKNPIPIAMLKIASGCTIEFRFILHDSFLNKETYNIEWKEKLFEDILCTVGIGAKTNVGYGQLSGKGWKNQKE